MDRGWRGRRASHLLSPRSGLQSSCNRLGGFHPPANPLPPPSLREPVLHGPHPPSGLQLGSGNRRPPQETPGQEREVRVFTPCSLLLGHRWTVSVFLYHQVALSVPKPLLSSKATVTSPQYFTASCLFPLIPFIPLLKVPPLTLLNNPIRGSHLLPVRTQANSVPEL